jgi:drug/metabolite transporter (DMT)-like permease
MTLSAIVLGEDPGAIQLVGAVLILAGVIISTSGHQRSEAAPLPTA